MSDARFGKFRLIAELGHGGMADVFLAVQAGPAGSRFRKLTVIKRLRRNLAEEPEFVAMLVDEARIAARLNHPNVVQTNEVGQIGDEYFISMEYLDGQPLHRIQHRATQRKKNNLPALIEKEQQYVILLDTLAGLHHAHELTDFDGTPLEIVHRDVTPQNIFVTYTGQVKVVDFGIAKAVGRASETRQGVVKGKVRYMAPEQAVGQAVDRRADIFSVGVMLWEVAAGRRMWKDADDLQIVHDLVAGKIPSSPREVNPDVPEELDRICRRSLAVRKEDRYETAEDFRADLEQFLADERHLVDARRQLAPSICELFKDRREEIRAVIEKQLSALDEKSTGEFEAVGIPQSGSFTAPPAAVSVPIDPPSSEAAAGLTDQKTVLYQPQSKSGGRFAMGAIAVAAVIVVAATGVVLARRGPVTDTTTTAAAHPKVKSSVAIKLSATPSDALVIIDNGPPLQAPVDMTMPKDDREHHLVIQADGYISRTQSVVFDSDINLRFDLAPATSEPVSTDDHEQTAPAKTKTRYVYIHKKLPPHPTATAQPTAEPSETATPPPKRPKQATGKPLDNVEDVFDEAARKIH